MTIHLRQICLVAEKLEPAIADLAAILGLERAFVDDNVDVFGIENTLLPVGTDFLEVIAPIEENTAAGRFLERRGGEGGYMVICQTDAEAEQLAVRERAAEAGIRVAWESERTGYRILQFHPGDLKPTFLEFDWERRAELDGYWPPVGGSGWEGAVRTDVTRRIVGAELQCEQPEALARLWGRVLDRPVAAGGGDEHRIELANAALRFVPARDGRGDGLGGLDLDVADRGHVLREARARGAEVDDDTVVICGTRFHLHP